MHNEYHDIIQSLDQLKTVAPDDAFVKTMENTVHAWAAPSAAPTFFLPVLRFASLIVAVFLLGGSGLVIASTHSEPGDLLYPVRQTVKQLEVQFQTKTNPSPTPETNPTPIPLPSPTPTIIPHSVPTAIPATPTPTIPPIQQSTVPTPTPQAITASLTIEPLPLAVTLNTQVQSPPTNAGSQDNNGAGTSLLPDVHIKIQTPIVKIGL